MKILLHSKLYDPESYSDGFITFALSFQPWISYGVQLPQGARHTFSEAVGKNVANPTAMLLASANMLNHVNLQYYGDMIENAVDRVIRVGKVSVDMVCGFCK